MTDKELMEVWKLSLRAYDSGHLEVIERFGYRGTPDEDADVDQLRAEPATMAILEDNLFYLALKGGRQVEIIRTDDRDLIWRLV